MRVDLIEALQGFIAWYIPDLLSCTVTTRAIQSPGVQATPNSESPQRILPIEIRAAKPIGILKENTNCPAPG
jgi:hypothetical protein